MVSARAQVFRSAHTHISLIRTQHTYYLLKIPFGNVPAPEARAAAYPHHHHQQQRPRLASPPAAANVGAHFEPEYILCFVHMGTHTHTFLCYINSIKCGRECCASAQIRSIYLYSSCLPESALRHTHTCDAHHHVCVSVCVFHVCLCRAEHRNADRDVAHNSHTDCQMGFRVVQLATAFGTGHRHHGHRQIRSAHLFQ